MKILYPAASSSLPEKSLEAAAPNPALPDIQPLRDTLQVLKKDLHEWRGQTGTSIDALKQAMKALEERLSACEKLMAAPAPIPTPAPVQVQVPSQPPQKTFNADLERLRQSLSGVASPAKGSIFSRFWTYLNESNAKVPARRP